MKLIHLFSACFYLYLPYYAVAKGPPAPLQDIVINEILFNPPFNGVDYIEIYNRSDKTIDLKGWRIANRNALGVIGSVKPIPVQAGAIEPGGYRVITEEPSVIRQIYTVSDPLVFIKLTTMPSYPNTAGTVVLLDARDSVADEVPYSENWHFALLDNKEGVALERIDFNKASADPSNWQSAATGSGYGTPGYKNSQYHRFDRSGGAIAIEPSVFSPDNDGYNDYAIISYKLPEPGYLCNITLFGAAGIPVRYLVRNGLCGQEGHFKWDGLNEKQAACPVGIYILFAEFFNLKGKTMRFKKLVTLARRLG